DRPTLSLTPCYTVCDSIQRLRANTGENHMSVIEAPKLAKKRKSPPPAAAPPDPSGTPSVIVSVRVSPEYRAWLDRLASFERIPISDLLDRALVAYAPQVGFKEVAPRR